MAVLPLANIGRILGRQDYIDEAIYQFLIHIKYLTDKKTGLWYHGYTFQGCHNFTEALWGRGNSWVTAAIPLFLEIVQVGEADRRILESALLRQVESLALFQNEKGMWHTLLDDSTSYIEASATCGFGFGILKAVSEGIIPKKYQNNAIRALNPILNCIDENGVLQQVSYGTPMGRDSKDFYKNIPLHPMPYGQAMAILFLMQVETEI